MGTLSAPVSELVEIVPAALLVKCIENRLHREKVQRLHALLLVVSETRMERELSGREPLLELRECCLLGDCVLQSRLYITHALVAPFTHPFCITEQKLEINHLDIFIGLNILIDMQYVRVVKESHYLQNCIRLADVREELVPEPLPFCGTLHEPCDIDKLNRRGNYFLALRQSGERFQSRVGHTHDTDRRVDGAKGIILTGHGRLGERIKKRGLPDVRQAYDPYLQH